ncbi:restriction endonuclease subunit S [Candidatus Desantisbacteria bacterium]|nr:restriction endonuclease subunit S [Candidatus Desantisbacteria bacterium]
MHYNKNKKIEEKQLGSLVIKIGSGITPRGGSKVYTKTGIPFIRSQNVYPNGLRLDDIAFITYSQHDEMEPTKLLPYDVLLNITGASIGRACVVPKNFKEGNVNQHVCIIRCKTELNPYFLCYFLNSFKGQNQINSFQAGGNRQGLNYEQIKKFRVPFFDTKEQQKIVDTLLPWDKVIDTTEKLIQNKKQLKKYLMQKLLSGEIRFKKFKNKKWEKASLKKFLKPQMRPIDKPDKEYKSLGIRSHGKGIFIKLVDNPESVMMDTLYQVKENDLILNITFAWEGAIAIVAKQHEVGLVSHRFPTFVFDKEVMIPEYFRYVIIGKHFIHKLGLVSPGGAGRNRVLDKKDFLELKVNIPLDINEQKKIADLLNSLDNEIQTLENYLSSFNNQKKGFMQKLLTGKIRVRIS